MKISYNWLLDFLPNDYKRSPQELAEILTDTGLEVEGVEEIESIPGGLKGIVIGEVLTCAKHTGADKLNCTTVNLGNEIVPIVCGAPNVAAGQKVLVATVGSTVHPTDGEPFKIKKAKIRGEVSQGMICAEDELSLGKSHDGIMVLPQEATVGQSAAEYFNITSDFTIEIGLTPNRTDAMSHLGVARDIVAALNHKENKTEKLVENHAKSNLSAGNCPVKISVENEEKCPRYAGVVIKNLKIAESPDWLKARLTTIGLKPINNVVDVTNYICHGFGHPMHAFDLNKVDGKEVLVKTLPSKTVFTSLDEVKRELHEEDLMICSATKPMCIAGVFGGIESGVSNETTAIFLESAYFNPVSVRKTAKRQALNTDASFRYERGIDPAATINALNQAVDLLVEVCSGEIEGGYFDSNPAILTKHEVEFSPAQFNTMAGIEIPESTCIKILADLDITVLEKGEELWKLEVPAYRADVTRHADICEEILRIFGFNNIPIPKKISLSPGKKSRPDKHSVREMLSQLLSAKGLSEGMSNGLSNAKYREFLGEKDNSIALLNPLSADLGILRSSMLFSALDTVRHNLKFNAEKIAVYEFGKNYFKAGDGFAESEQLSIILAGNANDEGWNQNTEKADWQHIKALVYAILERCGIAKAVKNQEGKAYWMEYGLDMKFKKQNLISWGKVSSEIAKKADVKANMYFVEINFDLLFDAFTKSKMKISELPKYPGMRRDLSLLLDQSVNYDALESAGKKVASQLLKRISLFDVYEGKNLEKGKKSYALSFEFRAEDKTLTDAEVDKEMNKITDTLLSEFNASLR